MAGMNRIITGKRGTGKSLVAIGIASDYIKRGAVVCTNLDMYPENFNDPFNKDTRIVRLPDVIEGRHLRNMPLGNPTLIPDPAFPGQYKAGPDFDESKNGLILADEMAHSGGSRSWNSGGRKELIEEVNLLRKRGYDTIFIAQDKSMIDKQILGSSADEIGYCRRMDRMNVPFLAPIFKLFTGKPLKFPKIHLCTFRMGESESSPVSERVTYRGINFYRLYNSYQELSASYEHETYTLLTPWHLKGRYMKKPLTLRQKLLRVVAYTIVIPCYIVGRCVPSLRPYFGMKPYEVRTAPDKYIGSNASSGD